MDPQSINISYWKKFCTSYKLNKLKPEFEKQHRKKTSKWLNSNNRNEPTICCQCNFCILFSILLFYSDTVQFCIAADTVCFATVLIRLHEGHLLVPSSANRCRMITPLHSDSSELFLTTARAWRHSELSGTWQVGVANQNLTAGFLSMSEKVEKIVIVNKIKN